MNPLLSRRAAGVGEIETLPVTGRDLCSASTSRHGHAGHGVDSQAVNRLAVVKRVAGEFIQRRKGDRVGLVLFGSRACRRR
jgi:Ca-activated chloride channel family protein